MVAIQYEQSQYLNSFNGSWGLTFIWIKAHSTLPVIIDLLTSSISVQENCIWFSKCRCAMKLISFFIKYNHIRCFSHCLEQCVILWSISQKIHRTFRTDFVIMRLFCCKDHKMIYNNNKIKKLSPGLRWKETQVSFIFNLISFIL